jgi:hypothetical protein
MTDYTLVRQICIPPLSHNNLEPVWLLDIGHDFQLLVYFASCLADFIILF